MDKKEINKNLQEIFNVYKKDKNCNNLLEVFINIVVPTTNEKDPSWETGARHLLKAITLSLLQNSETTLTDFTIDTIKEISELGNFETSDDFKNETTKQQRLLAYFRNQPLECRQLADAVLSNAYNTCKNFLCTLYLCLAKIS